MISLKYVSSFNVSGTVLGGDGKINTPNKLGGFYKLQVIVVLLCKFMEII